MMDAHHLDTGSVPAGREGHGSGVVHPSWPTPDPRRVPERTCAGLTGDGGQAGADGGRGAGLAAGVRAAVEQLEVLEGVGEPPAGRAAVSAAGPTPGGGSAEPTLALTPLPGRRGGRARARPRSTTPSPGGARGRAGSPAPAGPLRHGGAVSGGRLPPPPKKTRGPGGGGVPGLPAEL